MLRFRISPAMPWHRIDIIKKMKNKPVVNRNKKMRFFKPTMVKFMLLVVVSISLVLFGCSKDHAMNISGPDNEPFSIIDTDTTGSYIGNGWNFGDGTGNIHLMTQSKTFHYKADGSGYEGGRIYFASEVNESHFLLQDNALTPPPGTPEGANITITMNIDYNVERQEFMVTFGPHGCQFDPSAEIKIDYKALQIPLPNLFYIDENGNYTPQAPDDVNLDEQWMIIYIDHFSRYALARS